MIHYTYDAAGTKRRVVHQNGSDTPMKQYCENKVYDGTTLTMILHETGYLTKENGTWKYFYYLKDHVGSNRLVLDDQGGVVQINNYYPYGLTQAEPTPRTDQAEQPYKFGGKELDRDFGVDVYDFEARMYNPAIGRFMQPDPLAEKYYSISPYAYCGNNPVNAVDPNGMDYYYTHDGRYLGQDDKETQYVYAVANDSYTSQKGKSIVMESGLTQIMDNQGNAMLHNQFLDLAGTLYAEGSSTWEEAAGIYSVMENRGHAEGKTTSEIASGGGIYGYNERNKINDKNANQEKVQNAYQGLIRGSLDSKDYSGGGYFWHGKDFGLSSWRANKDYYQVGFEFTNSSHDLWGQGNRLSGNKSWDYKYQSTGAAGNTTFMRLAPAWQKATGGIRWNGKTR